MVDFKLEGIVEFEPAYDNGVCIIPLGNKDLCKVQREYLTELGESKQAENLKNTAERTNRILIHTPKHPPIGRKDRVIGNYVLNKSNNSNWAYDLVSVELRTPHDLAQICATFYDTQRAPRQKLK